MAKFNPHHQIRNALFDVIAHIVVSLVLALGMYLRYGELMYSLLTFAGGVLIDLDHIIDYYLNYGWRFDPRKLFSSEYILRRKKVYLPLHSWELVLALIVAATASGNPIVLSLALGAGAHLLIDHFQHDNRFFYFISYRASKSFRAELLCDESFREFVQQNQ